MSLTQLIHTVSIKLQKSEEEILEQFFTLAEVVKEEIFPKERLEYYNIETKTLDIMLTELLRVNFASKYFMYDCEVTDSVDFAVSLNEKCEHCGAVLLNSDNHIVRESYKLNSNFLQSINDYKKSQLKEYLIDDYRHNLDRLKSRSQKLIPFLGAGISIPFKLPSWRELLLELDKGLSPADQEKYIDLVKEGDYLKALSFLKGYSVLYKNEQVIKRDIKEIIKSRYIKVQNNSHHNILDIIKLDSQFIITTNYDNVVSDYLSEYRKEFVMPRTLETIDDLQDYLDEAEQRVIHLHGNIEPYKSMIVTKEDYDELYGEEKIIQIINGIMSNKTLLFIGFSFKDEYFKNLYDKIYTYIKGEHFIILPNLHPYDAGELLDIGLIPIGINVNMDEKHDFVKAVKTILEELY